MTKNDFVDFFKENSVSVYKYIFFSVNRNREIAEDLSQEVFIKAWNNKHKYDPTRSKMKTWVYTIAKNTIIDFQRKKKEAPIGEGFDAPDNETSHELVEDKRQLRRHILRSLHKLNKRQRNLIILRYIEDFSLREIAEIESSTYNATKSAVNRALKNLRKIINEEV